MNICSFDINRQSEELPEMGEFDADEQRPDIQVDGPNEWFCEKDGWN